ncbi:hypothetical protein [Halarchaeum sp. P4]|uniref:hypothetical protein n=1 Tax=Halarchaeum sp. P4 TaxID=3421639 RepID=UPI003EBBBE49
MRVRDWQDILEDVTESSADPDGWRAVAGDRARGLGEDLYLGHPSVGVYQLKTYAKNPFEVKGAGARVARRVDEDLDPLFPGRDDDAGRFAVRQGVEDEEEAETKARRLEEVLKVHAEAPTSPDDLFEDVMDVVDSPAFGPVEYDSHGRPEELDELSETFEEAEELLNSELDELIEEDDVGKGFQ